MPIIKALQKIGLSQKEADVYLAALELGHSPVQDIAKKSKVNRATCYLILESLMLKGIVSTFEKGKKRYFVAEGPERLEGMLANVQAEIKEQEKELASILPQLKARHNRVKDKPVVKFYEGKEGLRAMREEFLNVDNKDVQMIYSVDDLKSLFTPEERKRSHGNRKKRNIRVRTLYTCSDGRLPERDELTLRKKVPANYFPIGCDIAIFDNKVRIASIKDKLVGVIIEDKNIVETLRSIFNLAWIGSEKVEKGEWPE